MVHTEPRQETQRSTLNITIHILPNISGTKSNQAMKFGPLIIHNVRSIFLQKSCRKCGKETSSSFFVFLNSYIR